MTGAQTAGFQWGQRVRSCADLLNDGSYPDWPAEALLVARGEAGEIVQVGLHIESNTPVYLVEFSRNRVVGCLAHEIAGLPAGLPADGTESQAQ
jgi:nitrogen fixation protein NifZ